MRANESERRLLNKKEQRILRRHSGSEDLNEENKFEILLSHEKDKEGPIKLTDL